MSFISKNGVASRLLSSSIRGVMEEVDMASYSRHSGIGFVYNNLGELIKKVQAVGATTRPTLFQHALYKKDKTYRNDGMEQLKDNVGRLQEMQNRLSFMLGEIETLIKK